MDKDAINKEGYDKIAELYNRDRHIFNNEPELSFFIELLPRKARVLDVGCGAGFTAKFLVENNCSVVGIDISTEMLKLARKRVPEVEFLEMDMSDLSFPTDSFDGIVSLYAIFHIAKEKHFSLFQNFYNLIKPRGIIFFSIGTDEWEGTEEYYGTKIFWSNYNSEKTLSLVKDAGFEIILEEILERGGEKHYWIFARKPN